MNISDVFCAKNGLSHACICPKTVPSLPVLKWYLLKNQLFRRQKFENSGWKQLNLNFIRKNSNCVYFAFLYLPRPHFCHIDLDSRELEAIAPDEFDHARSIAIAAQKRRWRCSSVVLFGNAHFFLWLRRYLGTIYAPQEVHAIAGCYTSKCSLFAR